MINDHVHVLNLQLQWPYNSQPSVDMAQQVIFPTNQVLIKVNLHLKYSLNL